MNYTVRSINPIQPDVLDQNNTANDEFDEEQGEYEPAELLGKLHRIEIEVIHDECPVILRFLAGSKQGIQLEHTQPNYTMLEAYKTVDVQDIIETLTYEFPSILNHNTYAEHAEKATRNLTLKGQRAVQNRTAVHIELPNNLLINLTQRDILYFSDLEDAGE